MSRVKRFVVFAGDYYYPGGGWDDFNASFDTLEEVWKYQKTALKNADWSQVIDLETGEEVPR